MKIKTGLLSLMIVCGACSRTTQPADVLKDNFDFASGQLNFAFSEIDQVKSAFTEEQKEKMLVSPRNIEPDGSLRLVASRDWCSGFFPGELLCSIGQSLLRATVWFNKQSAHFQGQCFLADLKQQLTPAALSEMLRTLNIGWAGLKNKAFFCLKPKIGIIVQK